MQRVDLEPLIAPAVQALGYALVGVEFQPGGDGGLLRIYIDKEGGVNVDDCQKASYQISGILEVEDPIAGRYTLEVSSPGLDRPLYRREDYVRFAGKEVRVRLHQGVQGRRNFRGLLKGIDDDTVMVVVDGELFSLPLGDIASARLVPEL